MSVVCVYIHIHIFECKIIAWVSIHLCIYTYIYTYVNVHTKGVRPRFTVALSFWLLVALPISSSIDRCRLRIADMPPAVDVEARRADPPGVVKLEYFVEERERERETCSVSSFSK